MHLELIINCCVSAYFLAGFLGLIYIITNAQKQKSSLLKADFLISFFFLFAAVTFCVFSNFFTSKNLISSLPATQFFYTSIVALAVITPILLSFTYFLHQNIILGWLDEKFYNSRCKDALKLTFLIILSIFSFFILSDFMFEYFLVGINFRMSFSEKMASFLIGSFVILSFFYDGKYFIQGVILDQVVNLKKAIYMEFECGIFKENVINEEIGSNTDELQSMIERYQMTGNKLSKKEKGKMNELISKQNLLIHRRKLTNQFVTNKAKIINFLAKMLIILVNAVKIFFALIFIVSLGVAILGTFYNNDKLFNENPLEVFVEFLSRKTSGTHFPLFWSHMVNVILVKILLISYILYHTKSFFISEPDPKFVFLDSKEKQIRDVEKELNEVRMYFNLLSMFFFAVWLSAFLIPKYNLFIPDENCDLSLWKEENNVLLKKKCETTILGEIYLLVMQRKEIKIGIIFMNVLFFARLVINVLYGFLVDRKKSTEQIKVI